VAVDIAKALAGDVSQNILLQKDDQLTVNSIFDLKDQFTVSIQGEVRKGGSFPLVDSLNLKDLVFLAGGLTDAAYLQRVEVARFIRRDTLTADDTRLTEVFTVDNADDLSVNGKGLMLKPFDVVTIRRKPGYKQLQSVAITGEVQFPGPYVLIDRNEKLTDLIKRSGGFTPEAFVEGAFLKRQNKNDITDQVKSDKVAKIQEQLKDTTGRIVGEVERTVDRIPVDLAKVMADPTVPDNLLLEAGDELLIPKFDAQVRVNGEVIFPTQLPFSRTNSFKDYVNAAGGFSANALKRKSYVIYANGRADVAKKFLFFRTYPKVKPGAEIVVPKYVAKEQKRMSTAEVIGLSSAIASMAGIVIAVINLSR
jgi:protein involved in polysaccharide export with SLBB domain